jgi:sugar lactone lactonase YvrE
MREHAFIVGLFVIGTHAVQSPTNLRSEAPAVAAPSSARPFSALIPLAAGFGPEGIAVGKGSTFYVGSLTPPTLGQILVGHLRTGKVAQLVAPAGRPALGMKYDRRSHLLFVAGGPSGRGTVYDASSGDQVGVYQFQPPSPPPPAGATTVINDVVVTRDAVYFTDSMVAFLYRVPLGRHGEPSEEFESIPLPANFGVTGGCMGPPPVPPVKGNGIAAAWNGKHLILVHTSEGQLYRIDTATYTVVPIDLGGDDVCSGDGLLLDGKTLYVVQNFRNRVAVVQLSADHFSGAIRRYITEPFASNPATKVPTTIAEFGNSLYAVTAGFAPPAPDFVVRLPKVRARHADDESASTLP